MRLYGQAVGWALRILTGQCLLRSGSRVYIPSATFVSRLLQKGDVFVDVGAYDGLLSLIGAAAVQSTGQVHAFEPNPAAFRLMQTVVAAYGLPSVVMNPCAVGHRAMVAVLHVPKCETGASLSVMEKLVSMEGATTGRCEVQTLDDYVEKHCVGKLPTLVKIDVEGAELDVFLGGAALFSGPARPMIVFEASAENLKGFGRTVDEVINWLARRGYTFYVLRYPELVSVSCEADIRASGSGVLDQPWTDVLAIVPGLHGPRFELLRKRFQVKCLPKTA